MPLGLGVGQLVGLVREARGLEGVDARVAIDGPDAAVLAARLGAGAEASAIAVGGDPVHAAVSVQVLDAPPTVAEVQELRRISRAGVPLVVVQHGWSGRVPYVIAEDVICARDEDPVDAVAAAIARLTATGAPSLAARMPVIREAVASQLIRRTAMANAAVAGAPWIEAAHFPILTLAQARMLLLLGISRGESLPRDPRALAGAAAPALAGSAAVGLAARALVRRLPSRGPFVSAAVAYAATRALGAARLRLHL